MSHATLLLCGLGAMGHDNDLAVRRAVEATLRAAEATEAAAEKLSALTHGLGEEAAPADEHWSFALGFRTESISGNAQAYSLGLDANAQGQWGQWGTELKLSGAFGRNRLTPIPIARSGAASARGDRDFTPLLSAYVLLGSMFDHVASIDHQYFGEPGLGLTWLDHTVENIIFHRVRTNIGFRVTQEGRLNFFFPAQAGNTTIDQRYIYAPSLSLDYRYRLNRHVTLSEQAVLLVDVQRSKNLRANSDTALNVDLNELVTLSLIGKVRYIGQPAAGRRTTDTTLAASLTFSW